MADGVPYSEDEKQHVLKYIDECLELGGLFNWFDPGYLHSIKHKLQRYGFLTPKQRAAVDNIYSMLCRKVNQ